jgi:hypothetical protein
VTACYIPALDVMEAQMSDTEMVAIPVSRAAADLLRDDPQRREAVGRLVSNIMRPGSLHEDPLMAFLDALPRRPDLPEMTEEEIAAEVRLARAERRP